MESKYRIYVVIRGERKGVIFNIDKGKFEFGDVGSASVVRKGEAVIAAVLLRTAYNVQRITVEEV